MKFSESEEHLVDCEISKLLKKKVIIPSEPEKYEFVSPIFIVYKSDGGIRLILNLKELNNYVEYIHFKMDNI